MKRTDLRVGDLTEETRKRLQKVRNKEANSLHDNFLFQFAVDWENACNRLNRRRKGLKNA